MVIISNRNSRQSTQYLSFRYQWKASAGTYYYNSFSGLQRMDGFAGRFFIRQPPENEPHSKLYDYDLTEHSILVQQFVHRVSIRYASNRDAWLSISNAMIISHCKKYQFLVYEGRIHAWCLEFWDICN